METKQVQPNRIDERLSQWERRAMAEIQKNPSLPESRDFIRLQRDIYNEILKDFQYKDLNRDEKIAYRLVKAQARSMNKVLYPSRTVRAVRGVVLAGYRLSGRLVRGIGKILNAMLSSATSTNGLMMPRIPSAPAKQTPVRTLPERTEQGRSQKNAQRGPEQVVNRKQRTTHKVVRGKTQTAGRHL